MNAPFAEPTLTAYALGEILSDADRREVERLLAESPEARALIEDVRSLGAGLQAAYNAQRTNKPSRDLVKVIEFTEPHRELARTRSTTHLSRVAALVVASLAIASVAWFSTHRDEPDRIVGAKSGTPAVGPSGPADSHAYLEMEMDAPAKPAATRVENASYDLVRRSLHSARLPSKESVRIEEMVNYFSYRDSAPPADAREPIAVHLEIAGAPWFPAHRLVRIALKGRGTPAIIAQNLSLKVAFNPSLVAAYRRIGWEAESSVRSIDRNLNSGKVVAGFAATELYEIIPVGSPLPPVENADHGWQRPPAVGTEGIPQGDLLSVTINYQALDGRAANTPRCSLPDAGLTFEASSEDFKFAAAVAGFGRLLRRSPVRGDTTPAAIAQWAEAGLSDDPTGQRREFVELVRQAEALLATGERDPS